MSCDPPMNKKEIRASISFYENKRLIVSYNNEEQHLFIPCLFEFLYYLPYHSSERLVMFLPNIYPGLLKVKKMTH